VSVVSYIHTTLNIKYRYVGTYLPTYLLTWPPIFNLHSSVLGLLGCPETKFCTDTAFSMAEPAGGGETHAGRIGLFYGRTRRWRLSVCRGPETQIPTNILIHLSSNNIFIHLSWMLHEMVVKVR
jgi:hypothetical protein